MTVRLADWGSERPECGSTGRYVGLAVVEECRACGGTEIAVPLWMSVRGRRAIGPACSGQQLQSSIGDQLATVRIGRAGTQCPACGGAAPVAKCDAVISPDVTKYLFRQRLHLVISKNEHSEEPTSRRPLFTPSVRTSV